MLFIAGERTAFARLGNFANSLNADTRQAIQFAEIESIQPMVADDRIKIGPDAVGYYEVGLHLLSDADRRTIQDPFVAYAEHCKFEVLQTLAFQAGRMLFFPVRGTAKIYMHWLDSPCCGLFVQCPSCAACLRQCALLR